jgi:transposase
MKTKIVTQNLKQDPAITLIPKVYIGLDIHKKTWTVSIQTDLFFHKTYSMPANSVDLENYIDKNFPNHEVHLVYEASCCGFSVARYFLNLAWHVLVVNPADVKTGDKQKYQKTDALDANFSTSRWNGILYSKNNYISPKFIKLLITFVALHRNRC